MKDNTLERRLIITAPPGGCEEHYTIVEIAPNEWVRENSEYGFETAGREETHPDPYGDEIVMLLELDSATE